MLKWITLYYDKSKIILCSSVNKGNIWNKSQKAGFLKMIEHLRNEHVYRGRSKTHRHYKIYRSLRVETGILHTKGLLKTIQSFFNFITFKVAAYIINCLLVTRTAFKWFLLSVFPLIGLKIQHLWVLI